MHDTTRAAYMALKETVPKPLLALIEDCKLAVP